MVILHAVHQAASSLQHRPQHVTMTCWPQPIMIIYTAEGGAGLTFCSRRATVSLSCPTSSATADISTERRSRSETGDVPAGQRAAVSDLHREAGGGLTLAVGPQIQVHCGELTALRELLHRHQSEGVTRHSGDGVSVVTDDPGQ